MKKKIKLEGEFYDSVGNLHTEVEAEIRVQTTVSVVTKEMCAMSKQSFDVIPNGVKFSDEFQEQLIKEGEDALNMKVTELVKQREDAIKEQENTPDIDISGKGWTYTKGCYDFAEGGQMIIDNVTEVTINSGDCNTRSDVNGDSLSVSVGKVIKASGVEEAKEGYLVKEQDWVIVITADDNNQVVINKPGGAFMDVAITVK